MQVSRRGFITGLTALVAAPAIVKAESLMKIAVPKLVVPEWSIDRATLPAWVFGRTTLATYCGPGGITYVYYDGKSNGSEHVVDAMLRYAGVAVAT